MTWYCKTNSTRCENCGNHLSVHRDQIYCPVAAGKEKTNG